jgi:hypothetical protein
LAGLPQRLSIALADTLDDVDDANDLRCLQEKESDARQR